MQVINLKNAFYYILFKTILHEKSKKLIVGSMVN